MCLRAAVLIALLGVTSAQSFCSGAHQGSLQGMEIQLSAAQLKPNIREYDIDIPKACPSNTHHQGTKLVVCDDSGPPTVTLNSLVWGHVVRSGHLQSYAYVYTTLYCYEHYDAPAAEHQPAARPVVRPVDRPAASALGLSAK